MGLTRLGHTGLARPWKRLARHWQCMALLLLPAVSLPAQTLTPPAGPQAKLAPGLQAAGAQRAARAVRVSVADRPAFQQWVQQQLPAVRVSQPSASARTLAVSGLSTATLVQLAACPFVQFVDVPDRQAHEERQLNNSDLSVNAIAAVQARFPQLAGQGIAVSVKEQPFDPNDIDLKGRVISAGTFPGPPSSHATAMATLIGGAGNSHPLGRGVAREVRLATSDFARLLPDNGTQLTQAGISVQNHSYGVAIENYYGVEAQEYDRQVRQFPTLLHVFSSGNVGTLASPTGTYAGIAGVANVTGQFKMSKNTLTVGATDPSGQVAALSSRGPAYDGRIKPELVAYGEGGSSESAALVSGMGVLLQQTYRDQHSGTLPPATLVKAVLLNSADDLGRPEVDFVSGFGQADALGALAAMRGNQFFNGAVAQGAEQVFTLTVPAGQQLKATLVWADPDAAANAARALVNDLDLELVAPATGQHWQPWVLSAYPHADSLARPARRGADHLNNAEQITLTVPAAGTYELHVRGFAVPQGSQSFSLAYEVNPVGLEWISPQRAGNVRPGAASTVRWHWSGPATTARLEYRPVGQAQWRVASPTVVLTDNHLAWTAPDTVALAQLRLVAGSQAYASDTFAIVRAPTLQVGFTCPEETLLQWTRVPGVAKYQVYQMGATALVPLALTTDTALVLNRAQMAATRYYTVAPILQGKLAEPGGTIDYMTQGTACYFRSFLPRQLVDNTILFNVELGSVYRLRSATLERLGAAGYEAVQTLAPLTKTQFAFTDLPPAAGGYLYRVRLDNLAGQPFYSQVQEAYYLQKGAVQAFPNPVLAGETLRLIAGTSSPVSIRLYDMLGRFQRETTIDGVINQLNTNGLKPGLYLLRVKLESQAEQTIRVVIQ
ncbi:S8 family serine peptidase [Hymenobacter sedentarius]|nr:S8 family serine peptidase [Hymenobacter sedentarius]